MERTGLEAEAGKAEAEFRESGERAMVRREGSSSLCGFQGVRLPHGQKAASQLRAGTANVHGASRRQASDLARWKQLRERRKGVGRPFDGRSDGTRKAAEKAMERAAFRAAAKGFGPCPISGDNSLRDPPVPIPNTEVKPQHADSTWLETAR